MTPRLEKPRITEIHVRMDCNGCVQKIKKALHGVDGICEQYIDFPQQKITIIGWADPKEILKAIKKTRKSAIICSHTEPPDPPEEEASQGDGAAQDSKPSPSAEESANPPPEPSSTEPPEPAEPPKDPPQPPEVHPKTEPNPPRNTPEPSSSEPVHPYKPKDVEEVHVIYHHPPDYGYRYPPPEYGYRYGYNNGIAQEHEGRWDPYPNNIRSMTEHKWHSYPNHSAPISDPPLSQRCERQWHSYPNNSGPIPEPPSSQRFGGHWNSYPNNARLAPEPPRSQRFTGQWPSNQIDSRLKPEPPFSFSVPVEPRTESPHQPVQVTHSYNTYRPSPYVTGYEYVQAPPPPPLQPQYTNYNAFERYNEDYYYGNTGYGNASSLFSDENPNSCRIV